MVDLNPKHKLRGEKLNKHGFIHWRHTKSQDVIGALKRKFSSGLISYQIRESEWIDTKHLIPLNGRWLQKGNEIRFWNVSEELADVVVKRMTNYLNCGFCVVDCFPCRKFNRETKMLEFVDCTRCGRCLRLKNCMGWRHRFWRRIIKGE